MKKFECEPCGYIYDPVAGDRTAVSLREQHLRIFRTIGYAQFAGLEKMFLYR